MHSMCRAELAHAQKSIVNLAFRGTNALELRRPCLVHAEDPRIAIKYNFYHRPGASAWASTLSNSHGSVKMAWGME